jgi:hypothetical protein
MLTAGLTGCFDPETRVCNIVTSAECSADESCIDPAFARCPESDKTEPDAKKACVQPSAERCVAMGNAKAGEPCAKHAECGPNLFCIGTTVGICRQRCDHLLGGCKSSETCVDLMPRFNTPDDAGYCSPPICDPVNNTGCPEGETCLAGAVPICGQAGKKAVGQDCALTSDCVQQSFCLSTTQKCTAACDTAKTGGEEAGCKADESCKAVPSDGAPVPGNVGQCVPPCDVTTDQGCPEQGQCLKVEGKPPKCYKAGATASGEVCFARGECVHGALCIQDSVNFKKICARKCDPSAPEKVPCGNGLECIDIEGYAGGYCDKGGGP